MTILSLKDVKDRRQKSICVNCVIPLEKSNANEENVLFLETPEIQGQIHYDKEQRLIFEGNVKALLSIPCSKCLKEISFPIGKPFMVVLVTEDEEYFMDFDSHCYKEDQVDLWEVAWVQIVDEIPVRLLCKEDCMGICSVCGHNLNDGDCGCPEPEPPIDERMAKLRELLDKKED